MRILTVLNYYSPYISGLTEVARMVAEEAVRQGHAVTVLTSQHDDALPREDRIEGVRIVRYPVQLRLHKGVVSLVFPKLFRTLAAEADVIHFHLPKLEAGLLARLAPRDIPLVVTYHCDVAPSSGGGFLDRTAVAAVLRSARAALDRAGRIVVSSLDYARDSEIVSPFLAKCCEIPPPDKAPAGLEPRRPRPGLPRIGFLGRFTEEKGLGVLLEAFESLKDSARLVLAGNNQSVAGGSEYQSLREKIDSLGGAVEVPGQVPEEALFDFYRSLDVLVLPSINSYEAFGIVQVEAMKAGVPVVASDLRGVRVPIQVTGNGYLAAPGDARDLAARIAQLLEERRDPETVARKAWAAFPFRAAERAVLGLLTGPRAAAAP